jgi:hypothetical protein
MYRNEDLQLFLHICSKERKSEELLWIPGHKLQQVIVTQQSKKAVTLSFSRTVPPDVSWGEMYVFVSI